MAAMTEQLSASLLQYSHVALYRVDELAHLAILLGRKFKAKCGRRSGSPLDLAGSYE